MSIFNVVTSLSSFQNTLQKTLNTRLTNAQNQIFTATNKQGQSIFSQTALTDIQGLRRQFAAELDPRVSTTGFTLNPTAARTAADVDIFALQTMDVYRVTVQSTFLKGLLPSRVPLFPMVFNVLFPDTAENLNVQGLTDPLFLFVNPHTWSRSSTKVQTNHFTRNGYKTERWGDELETIHASGTLGGFYTQQTGLTRVNRRETPAYRNFMKLVQIFKNNGALYDTSYLGAESAPTSNVKIIDVGAVEILYGQELFRGTFDTFSITESADKPFSLDYEFTFHVETSISVYDISVQSSALNFPTPTSGLVQGQELNNSVQLSQFAAGQLTLEQASQIQKQQITQGALGSAQFQAAPVVNTLKPDASFGGSSNGQSVLFNPGEKLA